MENTSQRYPEFENRGALITGAASGMGEAVALLLAQAGAHLVLADMDKEGLAKVAGRIELDHPGKVMAVTADVSQRAQVEKLGQKARSFLPSLAYLVASAGILRRNSFSDIPPEEWDQVLAVNLTGCFLCCREVVPVMVQQKTGSIVLVASLAGRSTSVWGGAHYTSSKHGVIGLARHLARELGPQQVRVNAFCPGGTLTPLVLNDTTEEARRAQAAKRPLGRWASAAEQARVIAFLLSDHASFMTGVALDSNGGALMV